MAQQENYKRRVDAEKREEAKLAKRMEVQRVEAAKLMDRAGVGLHVEASSMDRSEGGAPIALKLGVKSKPEKKVKKTSITFDSDEDNDSNEDTVKQENTQLQRTLHNESSGGITRNAPSGGLQKVESRKRKNDDNSKEKVKSKSAKSTQSKTAHSSPEPEDIRKKNWIRKNILVRIITKRRRKYYKRKAVINAVHDKYTAEVEILDSGPDHHDGGDIVEFDQEDLETVIPKVGKNVMILNGRGRGMKATLLAVDDKRCRGKLELLDDSCTTLKNVEYDDFSKLAS